MDIQMKPMNGIEATEKIKKKFPEVIVLALSMFDDEGYIFDMLDKGASGYLLKNTTKSEIEEALSKVMNGKKYFSREIADIMLEHYGRGDAYSEKENIERLREVLFLVCHEFTTEEIAETLCLSTHAINKNRRQVLQMAKAKNQVGLLKYAISHSILTDKKLIQKFEKALTKKKQN
jgi:two-component system, NarL family, nitrate/nitrite response regulator NarL